MSGSSQTISLLTVFGKQDKNELPHLASCEYNISFISTSVRNNSVMELSGCTFHRARKIWNDCFMIT